MNAHSDARTSSSGASEPKAFVRRSPMLAVWRWFARHWIAHLTLVALTAVFVFPFIWMLGMSLKTDEEATTRDILPSLPRKIDQSPYVVDNKNAERPEVMARARWDGLIPELRRRALVAADAAELPAGAQAVDAKALRTAAAEEAVIRGLSRIDQTLFEKADRDAELLSRFQAALTPDDLRNCLDARFGRIELRDVQTRSVKGHVVQMGKKGQRMPWVVESAGNAEIIPGAGDFSILKYNFASDAPVVLRLDFDAGVTVEELHRFIVAYKGDASWHRFDAELTVGNQTFVSNQTTYVAQHRPASMLFQPPSFQDTTLSARTWVPMVPAGTVHSAPDAHPTSASLTLTLRHSSIPRAIYGKVERNYARAFRAIPFWTYVGNSVVLVVLQMGGALFSAGFVAYAFARLNWPGRSLALGILLSTMMLPGQVTMIPSFLIWRTLGWYNTLNPLWVGAWLGNAFFIFLMVQHMRTIPKELDEAAKIDGLNAVQTWWYVIMPQVKPTLAAIAIMTFMGAWNEFMGPLIMLRDQTKFPLSLGLFSMRLDAGEDWSLIMAGNLLMTAPVIVIFFLFQRYFIEGVTVSGMKG